MESIEIWNPLNKSVEKELVFGEKAVRWLYQKKPGNFLADHVLSSSWFSQLYGAYQSSRSSARAIPNFISAFKIPMHEYEETTYSSFNDFFIRKFKPGKRNFVSDPKVLPAFAEGRYLAFKSATAETALPIKGAMLNAEALLGDRSELKRFLGGPAYIARLCPVDYHRYHYPDDGTTLQSFRVKGKLHSVNPLALSYRGDILFTNERYVSILDTAHFGQLAFVEVGALCVGKIVQSYPENRAFKRGDEKGYFLFGGSTVVVLGEPGRWVPTPELLEQSAQGRETLIQLGRPIGAVLPGAQ